MQQDISYELIKLGLRPPEVYAVTGENKSRLRRLYKKIHGKSPPKGKVPQSVNKRIQSMEEYLEAIIFFNISNLIDVKIYTFNPVELITAYKSYKFISKNPLPFPTIYLLMRDIKTGWIKPKKCFFCGEYYLFNHEHHLMYRCPFCKIHQLVRRRG